ncbi:hypothetical protein Gpo141_00011459 [Globisporangium polare]
MKKALRRCKEERVTFFGALAASTLLAYYVGCDRPDKKETPPFKLAVGVDFNMRNRVLNPPEGTPVGDYRASCSLESLLKKGVDFHSMRFWDLARQSKQEIADSSASLSMPLTMLFLDMIELPGDLRVPNSISIDASISNVGKHPYKTTHAVKTPAGAVEDLLADSVHVHNSSPHLASAASLTVVSTDKLSYSTMHKYESSDAERVFTAFTKCVERVGEIASGETMAHVADRVAEDL